MIILGVDPGTAITGYGIINVLGNRFEVLDYNSIQTSSKEPLEKRLQTIYHEMNYLIKTYQPDEIAIEELFFNKNTRTALAVGHARGVILLSAALANTPIGEYTPLQVKQSVVGYGRAEKSQVQYMVKTLLNLPKIPKPDDVADALAIAICHAHSHKANAWLK